jgi:hypothetical protein
MLKFTLVSGSVRAITDTTPMGTIIRTPITDLITARTIGTEDIIVIIGTIIVIPTIIGASADRNGQSGLGSNCFEPVYFLGEIRGRSDAR